MYRVTSRWGVGGKAEPTTEMERKRLEREGRIGEEEIRKRGRRRIGGEIACFFLLLFVEFINKRHVKDAGVPGVEARHVNLLCKP